MEVGLGKKIVKKLLEYFWTLDIAEALFLNLELDKTVDFKIWDMDETVA